MSDDRTTILIVDDEEGIRSQLTLALEDLYQIITAATPDEALTQASEQRPQVILLDIALSPYSGSQEGLEILPQLLEIDPRAKVIMVTGNDERQNALTAVGAGAFDFYVNPINLDELKVIVNRAVYLRKLEIENRQMASALKQHKGFPNIIGTSSKMQKVFKIVETVAPTPYTVLISGESGTGKELIAKAIHSRSDRADKTFITINCGAIPETLLESELFGHEKGAFTDAIAQKVGRFELADKGTLFLDEIGELSLALQVKLLRFLQDRIIERVGGKTVIPLDVRVIAATNRSLAEEVETKRFREDLYYRLSVIALDLPPLREREDDVVVIANFLLNLYGNENGKTNLSFNPSALQRIRSYDWPGNVRELENRIKRAVILSGSHRLTPEDLGFEGTSSAERKSLLQVREEAESNHIRSALVRNNWNVSKAARDLGTSRTTLYDLLEKYKIIKDK
ncbi:MAG: PEP-CTERM-box response regulator transcription factor [candidate division Zixibacteria bacterium]|nr:PEP-CTERM-box response regulator transcription factor [candidate division Zixibacteria bacterium]